MQSDRAGRRLTWVGSLALAGAVLLSCSDSGTEPCVIQVAVSPSALELESGQTEALQASTSVGGGCEADPATSWSSSAPTVAQVSPTGQVTAGSPGTATITVTVTSSGTSASATAAVTVVPAAVAEVAVAPSTVELEIGEDSDLTATVRDASGNELSGRTVEWSSDSEAVATVSSTGTVTGVSTGTATVTATSEGVSGTAGVTVVEGAVASVVVEPSSAELEEGAEITLVAEARNSSGGTLTGRTATWESDAEAVATVSSEGVVSAIGPGNVTITATIEDVSGQATITVTGTPAELIHRWRFEESGGAGTTLVDDVGGADATLVDEGSRDATVSEGRVTLTGGDRPEADYVALPDGLLSGLTDATIELWATPYAHGYSSRIFDFGSDVDNYLTMTWSYTTSPNQERVEWSVGGETATLANTAGPYEVNTPYHIVVTIDDDGGVDDRTAVRVFVDGVPVGSFETELDLSDLMDTDNSLGRSQFSTDATAHADYFELRIYDGLLTPGQVAQNHEDVASLGPRVLSVAPRSLDLGFIGQEIELQPLLMDPLDRVVPGTFTFQSSNPGVAEVTAEGMVTAVAPGETTIQVAGGSRQAEVDVRVEERFVSVSTFQGHTYALTAAEHSWESARILAQGYGGRLAVIGSVEENDFLAEEYHAPLDRIDLWVGLRTDGGGPAWINDQTVGFTNWGGGQPDASGSCVHFWIFGAGEWNDGSCAESNRAIIEFDFEFPLTFGESFPFRGGHYLVTEAEMDWLLARDMADNVLGGMLAVMDLPTEAVAVSPGGGGSAIWIGLSDRSTEGNFVWVDDLQPGEFYLWGPGEPDGGTVENCGQIIGGSQWAAAQCSEEWPGLFEFRED